MLSSPPLSRHESDMIEEIDLAIRFDQQLAKLRELSSMPAIERASSVLSQADRQLARSTIDGIRETCELLQLKMDELATQIAQETGSREMLGQLRGLLGLPETMEDDHEGDVEDDVMHSADEAMETHLTPMRVKKTTHDSFDFDAFPSTPTLEQLGISGQSLALVGGGGTHIHA